jgi:hypothetical protein
LLSDGGIKPKKLPVCLHITETIETTFSLYIPSLLRSVYKEKHRKVQQLDQEDTFVLFQESIKCGTTEKWKNVCVLFEKIHGIFRWASSDSMNRTLEQSNQV